MPPLTDFMPLERLQLPGLGQLDCAGLVLVVGPNSSGKSQLLRDIHQSVSGEPRTLVVASEVRVRKLPYEPLVAALSEAGFIHRFDDDAGATQIRPMTTYAGSGQHAGQVQQNQIQSWHQAHNSSAQAPRKRKDEYLGYFGRLLVTALFLDHRLTSLNGTGLIDFVNGPPQHDLHALYMNDVARVKLFEEIRASFAKAVWPDISSGTGVVLRVSDQGDIPTPEDRLSPTKMNGYRTLQTEGDGLKSYVATCVALLLGRRPLCLVDEPEMCLHPPQAYNLGKFIGQYGASQEGATLVATHSSHVLRGVMQTAPRLRIVRLTRLGSKFRAHLVAPETLERALERPTVRGEAILDGIFAQAVVVLEADGDRTVYQAAWESLGREVRLDIHFATVGGTGGIADTCALYSALRIPVAVVADLDILTDIEKLRRVVQSLGIGAADELVRSAQELVNLVKALPPTVSPLDVKAQVAEALAPDLDWSKEHDGPLRAKFQQLARQLDRMRRLKTVGSEPFPQEIQDRLAALVRQLHASGLFVVPVGELEEWLPARGIQASRSNKWAWANEAASLIRSGPRQDGDVWGFMAAIGDFLQRRLTELA